MDLKTQDLCNSSSHKEQLIRRSACLWRGLRFAITYTSAMLIF